MKNEKNNLPEFNEKIYRIQRESLFWSILNRMWAEKDYKRCITAFAKVVLLLFLFSSCANQVEVREIQFVWPEDSLVITGSGYGAEISKTYYAEKRSIDTVAVLDCTAQDSLLAEMRLNLAHLQNEKNNLIEDLNISQNLNAELTIKNENFASSLETCAAEKLTYITRIDSLNEEIQTRILQYYTLENQYATLQQTYDAKQIQLQECLTRADSLASLPDSILYNFVEIFDTLMIETLTFNPNWLPEAELGNASGSNYVGWWVYYKSIHHNSRDSMILVRNIDSVYYRMRELENWNQMQKIALEFIARENFALEDSIETLNNFINSQNP